MIQNKYYGSRICYIIEETTHYLISILITGAYLAKLTNTLGFSDSLTAILASFVSLGCSVQLFAIAIFKRGRVKRRVSLLFTIAQLLFMMIYVVPFIEISEGIKTAIFIGLLLGGYFLFNIVFAPKTNWFMSLIPDNERGVFTSIKEGTSLIFGIVFQFVMGIVIDRLEGADNIRGAFVVCGITIFVMTVIHTLSLVFAKEREPIEKSNKPIFKEFKETVTDKDVMKIILVSVIWSVCNHISIPFFGTYQIKELGFSMTFVGTLSIVYSAVRILSSVFLGKYADKYSFAKMLTICHTLVSVCFLAIVFSNANNGYVTYTVYYMLYAAGMGGINSAETNIVFDYVAPERRTSVLAVKQTLGGVLGFVATLAATPLVEYIQQRGNIVFGRTVYAQQILAAISFLLVVCLLIYLKKVVYKITPYVIEKY